MSVSYSLFRRGRDEARNLEDQLRQLISDNPEQQARNEKAIQVYQEWKSFADEAIALAKVGQDVSDPKLQLRGKELMDRYRKVRTEFVEREEELRNERDFQPGEQGFVASKLKCPLFVACEVSG